MGIFEDAAAEICESDLGGPFVYFDGSTLTDVDGVFSNAFQPVESTVGPSVASQRPQVMIPRSVIAEPKKGDLLFQGERVDFEGDFDFCVASVRDDEEETSVLLILKKA